MLQSISPYALLKASKPVPKHAATTYDLYSAAQAAASEQEAFPSSASPDLPDASFSSAPPRDSHVQPPSAPSAARMPLVPARRTHYIADIKDRHAAALRRAAPGQRPPNS